MKTRVFLLMMIILKSTNIWASKYQSPAEAFVAGALSWLFLIAIFFCSELDYKTDKEKQVANLGI